MSFHPIHLLAVLGAVFLFGVNPGRTTLRLRLLCLLACSLFFAPFVFGVYALIPEGEDDRSWSVRFALAFAAGPFLVLWLGGLGAISYSISQLGGFVWDRWRGREGSGDRPSGQADDGLPPVRSPEPRRRSRCP